MSMQEAVAAKVAELGPMPARIEHRLAQRFADLVRATREKERAAAQEDGA